MPGGVRQCRHLLQDPQFLGKRRPIRTRGAASDGGGRGLRVLFVLECVLRQGRRLVVVADRRRQQIQALRFGFGAGDLRSVPLFLHGLAMHPQGPGKGVN